MKVIKTEIKDVGKKKRSIQNSTSHYTGLNPFQRSIMTGNKYIINRILSVR